MRATILFFLIFMGSASFCLGQNIDPVVKVNGREYAIRLGEAINNYPDFTQIADKYVRAALEEQFVPFSVNYNYSHDSAVYFLNFPVQNFVASVDKENKIAAIYICCSNTDSLMDAVNLHYGAPSGVAGVTTTDNLSRGGEFGIVGYANGRILVNKSRNSPFYNERPNMQDIVVISFINLGSDYKTYLSIYN